MQIFLFLSLGNCSTCCQNTEVEFRLKGILFKHKKVQDNGELNESFIDDVSLLKSDFNRIIFY